MKVTVLFFGWAHDVTGFGGEQAELAEGETLGGLIQLYHGRFPRLREAAGAMKLAVNQQLADEKTRLEDGDEVAFLPPVSGGAPDDIITITTEPISAAALAKRLETPADGALVTFEGMVRNNSRGRAVRFLEYEAYEPMALAEMGAIAADLRRRHAITRVAIAHRVGRLEIGEVSVAIAVAASHRAAAFDACRAAIDRLKKTAPIWKKEFFEDGAVWTEGEGQTRVLVEPGR